MMDGSTNVSALSPESSEGAVSKVKRNFAQPLSIYPGHDRRR